MKYSHTLLLTSLTLLGCSLSVLAADYEPATLDINSRGMSATAPNAATMLQMRIMGPQRSLIYSQSSTGDTLYWQRSGNETNGEYRYEVVVVTDNHGKAQQHNQSGGFTIDAGQLIVPVITAPADTLTPPEQTDELPLYQQH
jgi:hypothetical protein